MRLIDADTLYDKVEQKYKASSGNVHSCHRDFLDMICDSKTVESEAGSDAVRNAQWVDRYGGKYINSLYECSLCEGEALCGGECLTQKLSDFCPHCGAMMEMPPEPAKLPPYAVLLSEAAREKDDSVTHWMPLPGLPEE